MTTETKDYVPALRNGSYPAARLVAQGWHGGVDREITALSHKREWKTQGLIDEIEGNLARLPKNQLSETRRMRAELEAFLYWAKNFATIVVIWSDHGHRVQALDDDLIECMSCGAQFEEVHDSTTDSRHGRWRGRGIREPQECTAPVSHEDIDNCACLLH